MELISKVERTNVTIMGKIEDVQVNINYEVSTGQAPQIINASCSMPAKVEGSQPTYINVSRQTSGNTSASINGDVDIIDVAGLIEAIKAELEIIANEGAAA
ncbi:MAG: hypothetical protein NTX38_19465 [Methylobacter sp.]|nr:hypothetical protein [Methylobacter sp.]